METEQKNELFAPEVRSFKVVFEGSIYVPGVDAEEAKDWAMNFIGWELDGRGRIIDVFLDDGTEPS